jgi:peptidoglycan/xylan/chitin deacetylase (PgdA/CDA1 family)
MRHIIGRFAKSLLGTITNVHATEPVVALTFDDGPDPEWTPRLLEIMQRHNALGTFFMIGAQAAQHPDVVARVASGGHAIGNHTWDHPSFPLVSSRERFKQLRRCSRVLGSSVGRMFRPPYGSQNARSRLDLAMAGFSVVTWNVAPRDWLDHDAGTIAADLAKNVYPGSIIVLHDRLSDALKPEYFNRQPTLDAVELLLQEMTGRFRFVTVPQLLQFGPARRVFWSQLPDRAFLDRLKNREGVVRSY